MPPDAKKLSLTQGLMHRLNQLSRSYVVLLVITSILLPVLLVLGALYLLTLVPDIGILGILLLPFIIFGATILTPVIILLLPKLGKAGLTAACIIIITLGLWLTWLYFGKDAIRNAKALSYQIYEPAFIPDGYSLRNEKPYINKDEPQNYSTKYFKPSQGKLGTYNIILEINQFAAPSQYNPPHNCTYYMASKFGDQTKAWPCEFLGKTQSGNDIYINSQLSAAYGRFNDTIVTVRWEQSQQLTDENVLQIFGSLQPAKK